MIPIAFGHRKRVGKDTAARYLMVHLRKKYPDKIVEKAGYADKVKSVAYDLFKQYGLQSGDYYDHPDTEHLREVPLPIINKTPRELWIGVGNGIRAACGVDDIWASYLYENTKADFLIISDVRFPTEANSVLDLGGFLFKIECPWALQVTDGADDKLEGFGCWTETIYNTAHNDYNHLYEQIDSLIERYL